MYLAQIVTLLKGRISEKQAEKLRRNAQNLIQEGLNGAAYAKTKYESLQAFLSAQQIQLDKIREKEMDLLQPRRKKKKENTSQA